MKMDSKQGQKTTVVRSKRMLFRKSFKWFFLILGGVFFMLLCAVGIVYCLAGKGVEPTPFEKEQVNEFLGAVVQPDALDDGKWQSLHSFLDKVPSGIKKPLVAAVTRKSINVLRGNFHGLKTDDDKKRKVREIMDDIERNYAISSDTYKVFNDEFVKEGLVVYMREVSPEERALYDPIIHTFIRKLNSNKDKVNR